MHSRDLLDASADHAADFLEGVPERHVGLGQEPYVEVLNDVVLHQVLMRFGDDDVRSDAVLAAVQEEGTCWVGPTVWRGRRAMRISVSNWATTLDDVDRSCEAILAARERVRADTPIRPA